MAAIPAYERDPRLRSLDTVVVEAGAEDGRPFVVLADTVLYPEGGGQPDDRGSVGGVAVVGVRRVDGRIRHALADAAPSGRVSVVLDWSRRFDHMQQHTAQHLLTAVAERDFGWATTSFHLGEDRCDVELDVPALDAERLAALEEAVATEIRAARPVTARRVSPEAYAELAVRSRGLPEGHAGDVRLVEIEGLDVNTCGGTHCASTAELEALKVLGTESVRGGTRLFWVAGARVRRLLGDHQERAARLRDVVGTADEEIVERVSAKLEQLRDAERLRRSLEDDLADAFARGLAGDPAPVLSARWPGRGLPFLQRVARETCRLAPDRVVFLTADDGGGAQFVVAAGDQAALDVPDAGRRVADLLGGRGGGSGRIFQGKVGRRPEDDEVTRLLAGLLSS